MHTNNKIIAKEELDKLKEELDKLKKMSPQEIERKIGLLNKRLYSINTYDVYENYPENYPPPFSLYSEYNNNKNYHDLLIEDGSNKFFFKDQPYQMHPFFLYRDHWNFNKMELSICNEYNEKSTSSHSINLNNLSKFKFDPETEELAYYKSKHICEHMTLGRTKVNGTNICQISMLGKKRYYSVWNFATKKKEEPALINVHFFQEFGKKIVFSGKEFIKLSIKKINQ